MVDDNDDVLFRLAELRVMLLPMMDPAVLNELANFLEAIGTDASMVQRYKWFCEKSDEGADCKYARVAKELFLHEQADKVAKQIVWLYENWAYSYKE